MRATFFGIEIGKRAILAQRAAMDVTSHNIANANTPGYARQRAVITASNPWTVPNLQAPVQGQQLGTGVMIEKIESLRDSFIDEKIVKEQQSQMQWSSANDLMKEVESILHEPNSASIRDQLDKFWAAWENLSVSPNREELRRNLVEEAQHLVDQMKDVDQRLRRLQGTPDYSFQGSIENQLEDAVRQVNSLGKQISELNAEIGKAETPFSRANDLRDKRQRLLEELAQLVNVDSSYDSRGMLTVRVGRHVLVDTVQNRDLYIVKKNKAEPGTVSDSPDYPQFSDNPEVAEGFVTHTGEQRNFTVAVAQTAQAESQYSFLTFHPLTGPLSNFGVSSGTFTVNGRTFYLDAEKTTMNDLAAVINSANLNVNASINQSGQLVLDSAVTGTDNAIKVLDGTSNISTVLNLKIQQVAQNAVFSLNGKSYTTQENVVRDVIPGITLSIKDQGVANLDMRPIITKGKVKGLLDVRDGDIQTLRDKLDMFTFTLVTEVNDVHRQGFGMDGQTGRNFFKPLVTDDPTRPYKDAMKNFALETEISDNLNSIAAAQGSFLNTTDRLPTYNGDGDGRNAIAIAQIKQRAFFFEGKANFSDFLSEAVTQIATSSQKAERSMQSSEDVMLMLEGQRQSLSGVSLDEELANLIKFQHSYNAAAKVVTTVDEMLDKIINGMLR